MLGEQKLLGEGEGSRLKVIHYTNERNWRIKPINITNPWKGNGIFCKPFGGLWVSPLESEYGWVDWCFDEEYGGLDKKYKVIFDIDMGEIITINEYADIVLLPWYRVVKTAYAVDYEALKISGTKGVYLTEKGQYETRFTHPYDFYGWDCESIVILDEDIVSNICLY